MGIALLSTVCFLWLPMWVDLEQSPLADFERSESDFPREKDEDKLSYENPIRSENEALETTEAVESGKPGAWGDWLREKDLGWAASTMGPLPPAPAPSGAMASLGLKLVDGEGLGLAGLLMSVFDESGFELTNGTTNSMGMTVLSWKVSSPRVCVLVRDVYRRRLQWLAGGRLYPPELIDGRIFVCTLQPGLKVCLRCSDRPLVGALVLPEDRDGPRQRSNETGIFYALRERSAWKVSHPATGSIRIRLPAGEDGMEESVVHVLPRRRVRIDIEGYGDSSRLRGWLVTERGGKLLPDPWPGSDLAGQVSGRSLYALLPAAARFWVALTDLPEPLGRGLYGPFGAEDSPVIRLERGEALELGADPFKTLLVGAVDASGTPPEALQAPLNSCSPAAGQIPLFSPGRYVVEAWDDGGRYVQRHHLLKSPAAALELKPQEPPPRQFEGGALRNYLVCDRLETVPGGGALELLLQDPLLAWGGLENFRAHAGRYWDGQRGQWLEWSEALSDAQGFWRDSAVEDTTLCRTLQWTLDGTHEREVLIEIDFVGALALWHGQNLVALMPECRGRDHLLRSEHWLKFGVGQQCFTARLCGKKRALRVRFLNAATREPQTNFNLFPGDFHPLTTRP